MLPPFTDLRTVQTLVDGDRCELRLRRAGPVARTTPAPTPARSRRVPRQARCTYVVVGHCERRAVPRARTDERGQRQGAGGLPARPDARSSASARGWRSARRASTSSTCRRAARRRPWTACRPSRPQTSSSPTSRSGPSAPARSATPEDAQEVCAAHPQPRSPSCYAGDVGRRRPRPLRRVGQGGQRRRDHGASRTSTARWSAARASTPRSSPRSAATATTSTAEPESAPRSAGATVVRLGSAPV